MNFSHLDLNLLKVFDALFAEQSATKAGERLGLSQPAVSAALNRLRDAVGDRLFVRQGSRMVPTTRARSLHSPIREALERVEHAFTSVAAFDPRHERRVFRLFGSDFFSEILMPRLAADVALQAPEIVLQLIDNGRGNMAGQLADHRIHLALEPATDVPEWVSREHVFDSSFLTVASTSNKDIAACGLKPGEQMPLGLYCSLPHALSSPLGNTFGTVDRFLAEADCTRKVQLTLPQFHSVAVAVSQGALIATLPAMIARKYSASLGLNWYLPPFDLPSVDLHMYWHRRHDDDEGHKWLRNKTRDALKREVESREEVPLP